MWFLCLGIGLFFSVFELAVDVGDECDENYRAEEYPAESTHFFDEFVDEGQIVSQQEADGGERETAEEAHGDENDVDAFAANFCQSECDYCHHLHRGDETENEKGDPAVFCEFFLGVVKVFAFDHVLDEFQLFDFIAQKQAEFIERAGADYCSEGVGDEHLQAEENIRAGYDSDGYEERVRGDGREKILQDRHEKHDGADDQRVDRVDEFGDSV